MISLPLLAMLAAVGVIGFAASSVLSARPPKVDLGSLDPHSAAYWRRIERHERAKDAWL